MCNNMYDVGSERMIFGMTQHVMLARHLPEADTVFPVTSKALKAGIIS